MRIQKHQLGFTLIEALVALVIMAFGMLALTSLQLSLSRNADLAKQRTEATRLAQDRIERLRGFNGIDTGTVTWDGLTNGSEVISSYSINGASTGTNTSYTVAWSLGGTIDDTYRSVQVSVNWLDRVGASQSITLNTAISQTDPKMTGALGFPMPQNGIIKRPKNRNLNIPIQAIDLKGGESAYRLSDKFQVVFNDITGGVIRTCTDLDITGSNYDKSAGSQGKFGAANCSDIFGYIVAGYVSGDISSTNVSGALTPSAPKGVNTASISGNSDTIRCVYRQAVDTNSGAALADFHYYLCVIPVASQGAPFSGFLRLGLVPTTSDYKVCRVQYPSSAYTTAGERNEKPYTNVTMSLDNQNFVIENSNSDNCPTITSKIGNTTYSSLQTQLHQNCRATPSNAANLLTDCPTTVSGV